MQLLLDCYITLGDAHMAASSRSSGNGNSSDSSSPQQQQLLGQCNPSAAARSYLTALNFAPDHRLLVAGSGAVTYPMFSPMFGDLAQLRSQVQSKLNAALEMLADSEQTAVSAAATAAGSGAELQGGRRLALMQLGLAQSEQQQVCSCVETRLGCAHYCHGIAAGLYSDSSKVAHGSTSCCQAIA